MENHQIQDLASKAKSCIEQGQIVEAISFYRKALEIDPINHEVKMALATTYCTASGSAQQSGREADAIEFLCLAVELEHSIATPELQLILADYRSAQNRLPDAIAICQTVIKYHPEFHDARSKLVDLLLKGGQLDKAIRTLKSWLASNPEIGIPNNIIHVALRVPYKIGRLEGERDTLVSFLDAQREIGAAVPDTAAELCFKARSWAQVGDLSEAVQLYRQALRIHPDFPEASLSLCCVLHTFASVSGQGSYDDEAVASLEKLIQIRPDWSEPYLYLANILRARGSLEPALAMYKKAIERDPTLEEACVAAGDIIGRLVGETPESQRYLKQHVQIQQARAAKHPLGILGVRLLDESNTYAMGHQAELPDIYIKMQKLGWLPEYKSILLAPPGRVANYALLDYWREYFQIVTDPAEIRKFKPLLKNILLDTSYVPLPDGRVMRGALAKSVVEREWVAQKRPPLLKLSEEHLTRGWELLRELGVPRDAWFVSAHVRDPGFKNEGPGGYNSHRRVDIESFMPSFQTIIDRGGWVVRMGEPSMRPLKPMPQTIDYAHSKIKCDWMDLFFCSQCRFFIGTSGGLFATPQVFGVPIVTSNFPTNQPLQYNPQDIFISKLLFIDRENRYLPFKDALSEPLFQCEEGHRFSEMGLRFIDNTAEEIHETVIEMLERLEGKLTYDEEDEKLQKQYQSLFPYHSGAFIARMGRSFIKRYRDLLAP